MDKHMSDIVVFPSGHCSGNQKTVNYDLPKARDRLHPAAYALPSDGVQSKAAFAHAALFNRQVHAFTAESV